MAKYYEIDCWDHTNNTVVYNAATWDTSEKCAYRAWMEQILAHGGSWDAPDGCTYSIHEENEEE